MTDPRLAIGVGSGRCGTLSLSRLLDAQIDTSVSHERRPLLAWNSDCRAAVVQQRLKRLAAPKAGSVGDVASFYLPFLDEILRQAPDVRVVCLKRDRGAVIRSFCKWLDRVHVLPTDHWSRTLKPGWYRDPDWSRIFPKYDADSREEAIGKYWDEYYERAEQFAARFPQNVRIFDTDYALNTEAGIREVLTFVGIPEDEQIVEPGIHINESAAQPAQAERLRGLPPHHPARCVILVPHGGTLYPICEDALRELERRGYQVRRVPGFSQIDVARNSLATKAILDGFEETLWIDSDVGFHPNDVEKLRRHNLPIVSGVYAKKGKRSMASNFEPGTKKVAFGEQGGLTEIQYAATGFLHVRRQAYLDIQEKLGLPMCNEEFGERIIPWFQPLIRPLKEASWYLGEDFAFCERAKQAGYRIMADTSIRLWHVGNYQYGWEDAGREPQRFGRYDYHLGPDDSPDDR